MRTTVTIDDDLLAEAREFTGITETPALVRAALTALVEREAARRLARMGGSEPDLDAPPPPASPPRGRNKGAPVDPVGARTA